MAVLLRTVLAAGLLVLAFAPSVLSVSRRHPADEEQKYFHEAGGSLELTHYDQRFFKAQVPYAEHQDVLRNLVRSYLATMRAHGVETWLAHGTLLGWWWNAQIMPWDYDLDTQVSDETMAWLAAHLNGTEHTYDGAAGEQHTYLVDINPHYTDVASAGANVIDGRWIDVDTGMFVDITVLRERQPARSPGMWSCKNRHFYTTQDIWPLRATEFEGVPAHIPHNFENILQVEYSQSSLTKEHHQSHDWNHDLKQWVMDSPDQRDQAVAAAAARKEEQLKQQGRL